MHIEYDSIKCINTFGNPTKWIGALCVGIPHINWKPINYDRIRMKSSVSRCWCWITTGKRNNEENSWARENVVRTNQVEWIYNINKAPTGIHGTQTLGCWCKEGTWSWFSKWIDANIVIVIFIFTVSSLCELMLLINQDSRCVLKSLQKNSPW